jgi:hypothetical protein
MGLLAVYISVLTVMLRVDCTCMHAGLTMLLNVVINVTLIIVHKCWLHMHTPQFVSEAAPLQLTHTQLSVSMSHSMSSLSYILSSHSNYYMQADWQVRLYMCAVYTCSS